MDAQVLTGIATTAVTLLVGYLTKAGETLSGKAGEEVYEQLKARFRRKPSADEALVDLEQKPDDGDRQAAVRVQLKKILEENPSFVTELQQVLLAGQPNISQSIHGNDGTIVGITNGNVTFYKP